MNADECPFIEGDRVDHQLFGMGTVCGTPVAMVGPDMESADGVRDAGWCVPVRWDDTTRTAEAVMHHVLTKVSSPDAHSFSHWDGQWQSLLHAWLTARRGVEEICATFRPVPAEDALMKAQAAERAAFDAMRGFWAAENSGGHP